MKKVVIVCGFYNRSYAVKRTMDSLLAQDYLNLEIVAFDDCSSDDTYDKLLQYEEYSNVKIIRFEKNIGFVKGLIQVIDNIDADYVAIQGSGDVSVFNRISKQVDAIEMNKTAVICGSHVRNLDLVNNVENIISRKETYCHSDLLRMNPLIHGEVLFDFSIYEKVGGYDPFFKFAQDRDLWLRMTEFGTITVIPEVLYTRYIDKTGVSYNIEKMITQKKFAFIAVLRFSNTEDFNLLKEFIFLKNWEAKLSFKSLIFILKNVFFMANVLSVKGYVKINEIYKIDGILTRSLCLFSFLVFGNFFTKFIYKSFR